MPDAGCMWRHCDRSARIAVSALRPGVGLELHGTFCVPHAALSSRALRAQAGAEVWLDWARMVHDARSQRDAGHRDEAREAGTARTRRRRRGERGEHGPQGGPRWHGRGGPADPLEWAT